MKASSRSASVTSEGKRPKAGPTRWPAVGLLIVVAAVGGLFACAPTTAPSAGETSASSPASDQQVSPVTSPRPQSASLLRVGVSGKAQSLDPRIGDGVADVQVMHVVMESLLTMTPGFDLAPRLATRWDVAEDGRSIRLNLRDDVLFHDGSTFTSEDVKFSLEAGLNEGIGGPLRPLAQVLDRVDTPDPTTAIVRFERPAAFALYDLALIPMMPAGASADFGDQPVGTGPFAFDRRVSSTQVNLRRFEEYWGETGDLEAVEVYLYDSATELATSLARGDLDLAQASLPEEAVRILGQSRGVTVRSVPGMSFAYLHVNATVAPLGDTRVRSAISHLIPRERIVDEVLGGQGFPTSTVLGGGTPWSEAVPETPYDPARAQALLEEAGVRPGRRLNLLTNRGNSVRERIADLLRDDLAANGVTIATDFDEFANVLGRRGQGDYELLLLGWLSYGNPVQWVRTTLMLDNYMPPSLATGRIAELADAITRLDVSSGPGADAMRELLALLDEETAIVHLYRSAETGVVRAGLSGWEPHPVAGLALQDLQRLREP